MSERDTDLAATLKLAEQIAAKVQRATDPLERGMKIMQWPGEFRAILWRCLADKAIMMAREAEKS